MVQNFSQELSEIGMYNNRVHFYNVKSVIKSEYTVKVKLKISFQMTV